MLQLLRVLLCNQHRNKESDLMEEFNFKKIQPLKPNEELLILNRKLRVPSYLFLILGFLLIIMLVLQWVF